MLGKKIIGKKCEKPFFYIHTNIVTKKWGEQNARNNFSRNTRIVRAKNVGEKNCRKKLRKTFFYIHTNIVPKIWGAKNSRNNFFRNTRIVRENMLGKKSSEKSAKNVFLYSQEYRDKKMGGKTRETIFPETQV